MLLLTKVHTSFTFLQFVPNVLFSVPGSHREYRTIISHPVSLGSSWLWQFLRLSLMLMTWRVLRNIGQIFHSVFLNWDLSNAFLMVTLGLWVCGRKTSEVKCHSHHIISRVCTISVTYHCQRQLWSPGGGNFFFFFFLTALGLHCGAWASQCGGFSCYGARALGAWASVVVARVLSCPAVCGIFPDQGSNLCPRHWQMDS